MLYISMKPGDQLQTDTVHSKPLIKSHLLSFWKQGPGSGQEIYTTPLEPVENKNKIESRTWMWQGGIPLKVCISGGIPLCYFSCHYTPYGEKAAPGEFLP